MKFPGLKEKYTVEVHPNLYDLTPAEFTLLVTGMLAKMGYSEIRVTDGPNDHGIDIICKKNELPVAIQVKHKVRLSKDEIKRFISKYFTDSSNPRNLIFITSAHVPKDITDILAMIPTDATFLLLGRGDLDKLIREQQLFLEALYANVSKRLEVQKNKFSFSVISIVLSLIVLAVTQGTFFFFAPKRASLNSRIETVEKALSSIKDLETNLEEIKKDILDKEKTIEIVNQKYRQAKELDNLTEAQLAALKMTLQKENWKKTLISHLFTFILGIASSYLATVLYQKWQQYKAISD